MKKIEYDKSFKKPAKIVLTKGMKDIKITINHKKKGKGFFDF
jgi:heme-binding NEAT domain protein